MQSLSTFQPSPSQMRLLQCLLHSEGGASMEQLAELLGISRSAVQQQIRILEGARLIAPARSLPSGGRPQAVYTLTEQGRDYFPRQYPLLMNRMLEQLAGTLGRTELEALLYQLGSNLGREQLQLLIQQGGSRREAIVELMNELGYHAHAGEPEDEIVAHNCVYHRLAQEHPVVCSLDRGLLEVLWEKPVEQTECMLRGGNVCRFRCGSKD
ncbi:MAG: helix-turn-helix transcriptional regulator [Candidatus Sericytochromatia bacterium]